MVIYTVFLRSVIFSYNSLYTEAVAYTTYFWAWGACGLNGSPMANNDFQNLVLHNLWIITLKYKVENCIQQVWGM